MVSRPPISLLAADKIHEGFSELCLLGRLDLTVEYHVLLVQYAPLFTVGKEQSLRSRVRSY